MPPLSALLPVFGGNPPLDPVEGVVTQDVAIEPVDDTLPLVESNPFGPILLTGIADVPVTVAIAVVGIVDDVELVDWLVLLDVPVVIVVVVVEELDTVDDAATVKSFVVSSDGPVVVVVVVGVAVAAVVAVWAALLLTVVVTDVGDTEAESTEGTAEASDDRGVDASGVLLDPLGLDTLVPVPGAGVVSIGVPAAPFICASEMLSVAVDVD